MKMSELLDKMQYKWKQGNSLFTIFQETRKVYDRAAAQAIFHSFVRKNRHDKRFMDEFNSTSFDLT
jgi:hypothetical protein